MAAIQGRLTKDVELKEGSSGKKFAWVTVAYDVGWGEKKQGQFQAVKLWEKDAEFAAQYGRKGSQVTVGGELRNDEFEVDGQKRKVSYINARSFAIFKPPATQGARPANNPMPQNTEIEEADIPF